MTDRPIRIGIIAGEASGDQLAAALIAEVRQRHPNATFVGMGGPLMQAEGCHCLFDSERIAYMGFLQPLVHLNDILRVKRDLIRNFLETQIDLYIGIDSPDFTLRVAKALKAKGVPTMHYVSPSVWAWRKGRIHGIKKAVDHMLVLFPFEMPLYESHQIPVTCVGHPLADKLPVQCDSTDNLAARNALALPLNAPVVTLLPGSRRIEYRHLLKPFLQTAKRLHEKHPNIRFVAAVPESMRSLWKVPHEQIAPEISILFADSATQAIQAADVVLACAGTVTLECLLLKRPLVIAYRMSWFNELLARLLVNVPFIGLPNLLAGESVCPEFLQRDATPENLAQALSKYLQGEQTDYLPTFIALHESLALGGSVKAAEVIDGLLAKSTLTSDDLTE